MVRHFCVCMHRLVLEPDIRSDRESGGYTECRQARPPRARRRRRERATQRPPRQTGERPPEEAKGHRRRRGERLESGADRARAGSSTADVIRRAFIWIRPDCLVLIVRGVSDGCRRRAAQSSKTMSRSVANYFSKSARARRGPYVHMHAHQNYRIRRMGLRTHGGSKISRTAAVEVCRDCRRCTCPCPRGT